MKQQTEDKLLGVGFGDSVDLDVEPYDLPIVPHPSQYPSYQDFNITRAHAQNLEHLNEGLRRAPRISRFWLVLVGILVGLFALGFFVEDTNADAYILNELFEYILAREVVSSISLAVGSVANAIPNIPMTFLLFSLTMIKLSFLTYLRRSHRHHAAHEMPLSVGHHHHHHSTGETIVEFVLIGMTSGSLAAASTISTLREHARVQSLKVIVPLSVGSGLIAGTADWMIHSYFNHAAEDQGKYPLIRTFRENLWWRTDIGVGRKIHDTWVKSIIIIMHGGMGCFNWYSLLSETGANNYLPLWCCGLLAGALATPLMLWESVSETFVLDESQKEENKHFEIHRASKGGLILGGAIHALGFIILLSRMYQATPGENGPYFWLINLLVFAAWCIPILYPAIKGFYVMLKFPPKDHDGNVGLCLDDVTRSLIGQPRPTRAREGYLAIEDRQSQQTGKWCCCFPRRRAVTDLELIPLKEITPIDGNAQAEDDSLDEDFEGDDFGI